MEFLNKCAISTGAASGMGLLFAQNFADLGGNVVLCDVNDEVLKEKVDEIFKRDKESIDAGLAGGAWHSQPKLLNIMFGEHAAKIVENASAFVLFEGKAIAIE